MAQLAATPDGAAWLGGREGDAVSLVAAVAAAAARAAWAAAEDPAAAAAALHAAAALLNAGALTSHGAQTDALVTTALALAAGEGVPLEVSSGGAALLAAAGRAGAPALDAGLRALVPAESERLPPLALLEAACALGGEPAGRALLVRSGGAAAVGHAFAAWWGGAGEAVAPPPSSSVLGSPRQRALDAVLILSRHADTLAALDADAATASAALRAVAERLWVPPSSTLPPPPRDAAVGAALATAAAVGAAQVGLKRELDAWASLPVRVVEGLGRGGATGGSADAAAAARSVRQATAAWASLAAAGGAVAASVAATPWAAALMGLLTSPLGAASPAIREAGVGGLGLAVRLGGCGQGVAASALARAAAAPLPGSADATDDAGAAALDALAGWLECGVPGLRAAAAAAVLEASNHPHPLLVAGLAPAAPPALASAAARVVKAAAGLPGADPADWLPCLATSLAGRAAGEGGDALAGEEGQEVAAAAALATAGAWVAVDDAAVSPALASSLASSVVTLLGRPSAGGCSGPVEAAALALAAALAPHLPPGGGTAAALAAAVGEVGGGEKDDSDADDALTARLRLLALVGEPVEGGRALDECV